MLNSRASPGPPENAPPGPIDEEIPDGLLDPCEVVGDHGAEPDVPLCEGKVFGPPLAQRFAADPGDVAEARVLPAEDELGGREDFQVGLDRSGSGGALPGSLGLAVALPR